MAVPLDPERNPVETLQELTLHWGRRDDIPNEVWNTQYQARQHYWTAKRKARRAALRSLTMEQAQRLARWALEQHDKNVETSRCEALLGQIANYVDGALVGEYPEVLARNLLFPWWMYRGADPATRDELIRRTEQSVEQVETEECPPYNALLQCLAWVGDGAVQALFTSWRTQPPDWPTKLYIPPEDYATVAGWELTPTGARRDLFMAPAYMLPPLAVGSPTGSELVVVPAPGEKVDAMCGWCGRQLQVLFDLDLRDPRLAFLGLVGTRLRIVLCPFCSYFAPVVTDVDYEGRVAWSAENGARPAILEKMPDGGPDDNMPPLERQLVLGPRRRTPAETLDIGEEEGDSQLGGLPNWIQDAEYPICPGCQRRMVCVGQVAMDDIIPDHEGITYAFLCAECGKAATTYQQT